MRLLARLSKNRSLLLTVVVVALAVGLIGYCVWGFAHAYLATHQHHVTIPLGVVTNSSDTPDETPPTEACKSYKVSTNKPRKVEIPSIGVSVCMQTVGVDQHKAVAVPSNIHLAGWYTNSVLPGAPGVSLIVGHVSGRYDKNAAFSKLAQLKQGAVVRVQFGDGTRKQFTVKKSTSYPVETIMDHALEPLTIGTSELNLVTCGGPYVNGEFTKRVLVQAKLSP
jgi:LPXTG-site transpeptidase (sortase) family protein